MKSSDPSAGHRLDEDARPDIVDQLLGLDTVDDIMNALERNIRTDAHELWDLLNLHGSEARFHGRTAEVAILQFLVRLVEEVLGKRPDPLHIQDRQATAQEIIQNALQAPSLSTMYAFSRRQRQIFSLMDWAELEFDFLLHPYRPDALSRLRLLRILARLVGGARELALSCVLLGGYWRRVGDHVRASRYLEAAGRVAKRAGDVEVEHLAAMSAAVLNEPMWGFEAAMQRVLSAVGQLPLGDNGVASLGILHYKASSLRSMGRYREALSVLDEAIPTALAADFMQLVMKLRLLRGLVLEDLGDYAAGGAEYELLVREAEVAGDRAKQFEAMNNAAAGQLKRGNVDEGVRQFHKVLSMVKAWGNQSMVASAYNNVGNAYAYADRPGDALTAFLEALHLGKLTGEPAGLAIAASGAAHAMRDLGNDKGAEAMATLVLMAATESGQLDIAMMWAALLQPSDESTQMIRELLDWAHAIDDRPRELQLALLLAHHLDQEGKTDEAVQLCQSIMQAAGPSDVPALDQPELVRLKLFLVRLLRQRGEHREAYGIASLVLNDVERAISKEILGVRRGEVVAEWNQVYSLVVDLLSSTPSGVLGLDPKNSAAALAFEIHEQAKCRSLVGRLALMRLPAPDGVDDNALDEEERLLAQMRELQEQNPREAATPVRLRRLDSVLEQLSACWDVIGAQAPEYVQLRRGEPIGLEQASRTLLNSSASAVSYFCGEESTTWFVIRPGNILASGTVPVGRPAITDVAEKLRRSFNGDSTKFPPSPPIRADRPYARDLSFLDQLSPLLYPFELLLQDRSSQTNPLGPVVVAPHGPLHLIPLHALRFDTGDFVAEHLFLTYVPSLTTLGYLMPHASPLGSTSLDSLQLYLAALAADHDPRPEFFEDELAVFGGRGSVTAHEGPQAATRSAVLDAFAAYDVLHLTSHGRFDDADPLSSGLVFADGSGARPNLRNVERDPLVRRACVVSARDIISSSASATMITMRACSTGLQRARHPGDEFDGLVRSLLYGGVSTVVASLWNVDAASSRDLLAEFYQCWLGDGSPRWKSMWAAQRSLLGRDDAWSHPYHWAPLVLVGDWR